MIIKSCFIVLASLLSFFAKAQKASSNDLLKQEPHFLNVRVKATDSLFLADLKVLKQFIPFDGVDNELLKPQLLAAIVSEAKPDTVVTYQKLIDVINTFKQGIGYIEFRKGIVLYREMAELRVNPNNWEKDQLLFRKLGFTEADLEDFLLFISKPENKNLNYKQAYLAYMKEIDNL